MKTQRFKLIVEYDGRPYSGWQRQKNAPSVQAAMEEAFSKFAIGEEPTVHGSGRTDTGVHALGQVAHVDIARDMTADSVMGAFNYHLRAHPITVLAVEAVDNDFHARFSAVKRHYVYRILNRRTPLTFQEGLVWGVKPALNVAAMHEAAQLLVGKHDFTTFRHVHCQAESPIKTMDYLSVDQVGDEIHVTAGARSFLHHQIRSITGTLMLVGAGKWTKADVAGALAAKDRARLKLNAPPDGLYFKKVDLE
ncbi:MAG: tRNA pseudouridine(38-40) synthase TruA [Kordiimonadaceae bacterium]|nr:tRNA pseudouridine(38-40) synthase TruA [Kordiimonadaceae bacterium]